MKIIDYVAIKNIRNMGYNEIIAYLRGIHFDGSNSDSIKKWLQYANRLDSRQKILVSNWIDDVVSWRLVS